MPRTPKIRKYRVCVQRADNPDEYVVITEERGLLSEARAMARNARSNSWIEVQKPNGTWHLVK